MKIAIHTSAIGVHVSGGIGCVVEVLNRLQTLGHEVYCFVDEQDIQSRWLPASFPIINSTNPLYESFDGILISPFSPTARAVAEHKNAQDKFYWIHTNEGLFTYNGPEWQKNAINSYKLPLKIFCTSHYVRILMEQVYNRNCIGQLVPPGVDFKVFNTTNRGMPNYTIPPARGFRACTNIGFFARPGYIRGTDIVHNVMRLMKFNSSINPATYNFIRIPDGIRDRKILAEYYKKIDLFLDPSRLAGSNTTVKEAMACGAVVIGTPYGNTDMILDGINGFIVPVDDSIAIENKIKNYLNMSDNSRRQMHELAFNSIKGYSWEGITSMFLLALNEGINRRDLLWEKKWL